ncbi:MAG: tape measure protein [Bacteroides graminisolvens]|nr:tape measure protein [Bacteroides graminisolvens]
MALNFDITGNNTDFLRKIKEVQENISQTSKKIASEGDSIESYFSKIAKSAAAIGLGLSAKEIVSNVTTIRGQFQQLEVAFRTMLGNEKEADSLMRQLVKTAATTPFDLQSVSKGAKQLLAYGSNAESVNNELIMLGDVASGVSIPLGDLVYLYGTLRSQGRAYAVDIRQFAGRGIPIYEELAKVMGVNVKEVNSLVEAGEVGFPQVEKAFKNMTSAGGMFYNLMEEQSKTITGQISNIGDSISVMYNNIGKSSEGFINTTLSGTSYIIKNYEEIGKVLIELTATYGAYKAVLIAVAAMQNLQAAGLTSLTAKEAIHYSWLVITKKANDALNASLLSNPYAIVAASVATLGYGIYKLYTYQTDAEKAQSKLNDAVKEMNRASLSEQRELAKLKGELSALTKGTDEYNVVKDKIVKGYGKYYDGLESEIEKVGLTEQAYRKLTEAITQSFGARQYEKFKNEQTEELDSVMSDNLGKIQKELVGRFGDLTGGYFYAKIRDSLLKGSLKYGGGMSILGLDKGTQMVLDMVSKAYYKRGLQNKYLEGKILNIIHAQGLLDKVDKEAKARWGINEDDKDKDPSEVSTTYQQDVAAAKAAWDKAKKAYTEIIKDEKATAESVKNARLEVSTAEQKYKNLTGSDLGKQDDKTSELKKEQQAYVDLLSKQSIEERRANENLYNETVEDRINAMDEGSAKVIAQMEYNFEKEMQAIDRAKEDKLRDKIEDARAAFEANPKNKGKSFDSSGISLSDEENAMYDSRYKSAVASFEKEQVAFNQKSRESQNNYLKEWGTVMEKRKAITESYSDKIAKTDDPYEKKSLTKQMQEELSNIDLSELKESINWEAIFGNLSALTKKQLQDVKKQLVAFKKSPEFKKNSTPEQMKVVEEAINNLNTAIADKGGLFGGIESSLMEYKKAVDDVTESQKKLEEALKSGDDAAIEKAKKDLNNAKNSQVNTQGNVNKSQDKAIDNITSVTNAISQLGEADVSLTSFGNTVGTLVDALSESGSQVGGIIAALLAVMDQIGQKGLDGFLSDILEASWHSTGGIIESVGKIFGIKGAGGIFAGADYSGYNEMVSQYDRLNDIWDELIDKKKEYIETSYGEEAVKASKEAEALINKSIESYRTLGVERLNSGSSTGSHSIGVRQRKNMSSSDWAEAQKALGSAYDKATEGRMVGLFDLSVEQLEKLKSEAPTFWAKLDDDVRGYLNSIIEGQERIEEIQETLKESVTGISFDSFFDGILDSLYDVETTYEDIADNMSEYIRKSLIKAFVIKNYKDGIREWYDMWAKSLEDNTISSDEQKALDDLKSRIITGAVESAKLINDQFDTSESSSQEATSKGFNTMDQDTGNELNGRFAAFQITGEETKNAMLSILTFANNISVLVSDNNIIMSEIRNLMVSSNSYLEDIAGYNKKMYNEFGKRLENIEANSRLIAG